jgi:excisionase family DNA binding protein
MPLSIKQAADAVGRTKSSILRAIKAGKMSATKDGAGEWQIDPAELHRVYAPAPYRTDSRTAPAEQTREVTLLREMLADRDAQIADLREDRDRWRAQAERLALPAPRRWWRFGRHG